MLSLFQEIRILLGLRRNKQPEPSQEPATTPSGRMSPEAAAAWLEAFESGALRIPEDVHDAEGWDRYWSAQVEHGGFEQGFNDMMASDAGLIETLNARSARTVLCVGNGLSSESFALTLYGFDVTVLDLSRVPRAVLLGIIAGSNHPFRGTPGFTVVNGDEISFETSAVIDAERVPPMHKSDTHPPIGGGRLRSVTGDVLDASMCPGPFDAVIERRTLQLLPKHEQALALERLTARLAPRGLLVSHQHNGGWRPDQPREHFASDWTRVHGFTNHYHAEAANADRVAWLFYSTG